MTEPQQLPRTGEDLERSERPGPAAPGVLHPETLPTEPPPLEAVTGEPTLLGFPAEVGDEVPADDAVVEDVAATGETRVRLVVLQRTDPAAGSLLLVAGCAGELSLFLPWVQHDAELGLTLVRRGVQAAGEGLDALASSGLFLPLGVVVAGGVLFVLGLLAFRPATAHRVVGLLALFVSLAVAAGVVVRGSDAGWDALRTDPGILCAVALAGVGLAGALKAMLTPPQFETEPV